MSELEELKAHIVELEAERDRLQQELAEGHSQFESEYLKTCDSLVAANEENALLRKALTGVYKLPRPWIDGGVTYAEWDEAMTNIEAALARIPEAKPPHE